MSVNQEQNHVARIDTNEIQGLLNVLAESIEATLNYHLNEILRDPRTPSPLARESRRNW
jgi:hypothetical protein